MLRPYTRKRRPSRPMRVVLWRIALMMASNPAAEDVDMVLYSLANISRQLRGGPPLPPLQLPPAPFVFGQANSANTYAQEAREIMREHRSVTQLVGITEVYPDSIHDLLCDEDPLSDASCTGDNYWADAHASPHICAMAAAPREELPLVEPSNTTHTPPDPRADMLTNVQAHAIELRALPA